MPKDKELITVPPENSIVNFNVESLMAKAIEHGLSPETMEKFLAMRQQLKAEWAREQYNRAMAAFQAECPTIQKTKEVKTKAGIVAYRYAPIESIVQQVAPALQRNGFSYSTNMELLEAGVKVSVKTTHIDGHSEITEMSVPLGNKTDIMSQSQVVAAAQTFAKRYAFCNAFGILTGDEDTDAAPMPPDVKKTTKVFNKTEPEMSDLAKSFAQRLYRCNSKAEFEAITGELSQAKKDKKFTGFDLKELSGIYKAWDNKFNPPVIIQEKPKTEAAKLMEKGMEKAKEKIQHS